MADQGFAELDRMIECLRTLGPALTTEAAPAVAKAVERELDAQISRAVGPDGRPWKATQDGRTPLRNAAKALSVRAIGDVVVATLEGAEARHHLGAVKGGVKRQILPTGKIPDPVTRAIKTVLTTAFQRKTGGVR